VTALDGEHVVCDGSQLGRPQTVADRHLTHELEHRLAPHAKGEQIATLAAR
jgi:hypothetical protein